MIQSNRKVYVWLQKFLHKVVCVSDIVGGPDNVESREVSWKNLVYDNTNWIGQDFFPAFLVSYQDVWWYFMKVESENYENEFPNRQHFNNLNLIKHDTNLLTM